MAARNRVGVDDGQRRELMAVLCAATDADLVAAVANEVRQRTLGRTVTFTALSLYEKTMILWGKAYEETMK